MKRSLIEIFKFIDYTTWTSCIKVSKIWFAAGMSNDIIKRMIDYDTYEEYQNTRKKIYNYYYTTTAVITTVMGYPNLNPRGKNIIMSVLNGSTLMEFPEQYKIVKFGCTFIFHKLTIDDVYRKNCLSTNLDVFYYDTRDTYIMYLSLEKLICDRFKEYGYKNMLKQSFDLVVQEPENKSFCVLF